MIIRLLFPLFVAAIAAHAGFSVNPFTLEINASRGEYNGWVELTHTSGNAPHALELTAKERDLDLDGKVKTDQKIVKEFTVYPSQILLTPGKKVKVQVVYKGQKIEADRAYLLDVKEVPLPTGHKEKKLSMGLAVLVNYNVGILMDTGKPSALTFVSSKTLDSGKVEVIMENKSNGRFSLNNMKLYANGDKMLDFGETNSVMPGQQRRFVFNYNKPLTAEEVRFGK